MRTIKSTIQNLPKAVLQPIPAPKYTGTSSQGAGLAVECMKRHMSNEGWQYMLGLEAGGYVLHGHNVIKTGSETDVRKILDWGYRVVVVQDKREWMVAPGSFRESKAKFTNIEALDDPEVFSIGTVRDAHHKPSFHDQSAREMGVNAWVCFYNPDIVHYLAPYTRREHLIRTYNCIDKHVVPDPLPKALRKDCLLSGAVSSVYPLRKQLLGWGMRLDNVDILRHPGYHASGTNSTQFLQTLNQYKIAVCTSSIYGYALRKIIEATACGCIVLTDLPTDEILPEIEGNLFRVHPRITYSYFKDVLEHLVQFYDLDKQRHYADKAKEFYDYRAVGARLVSDIEELRCVY